MTLDTFPKTNDWNRKMEDDVQVPCEFLGAMLDYQTRSDLHLSSCAVCEVVKHLVQDHFRVVIIH